MEFKNISVILAFDVVDKLDEIAKKIDRNRSYVIRRAVTEFISQNMWDSFVEGSDKSLSKKGAKKNG